MAADRDQVVPFDTTVPNIARIYDYWLGGKDNFAADRQAAEAIRERRPNVAEQALDNKRFLTRAVRYVAGHGVRQFLDVGAGLPTSPGSGHRDDPDDGDGPGTDGGAGRRGSLGPAWLATHEAAQAETAGPLVAYVDYDPVAVRHSQALLADASAGVVAVEADMHEPDKILGHPSVLSAGFDSGSPACVILACVLHFVPVDEARDIVAGFTRALVPGSYLIASVGYGRGEDGARFAQAYNAQQGPRIYAHSWAEITGFFDGLELIPPGVADTAYWPLTMPDERSSMIVGGVARKP